MNETATSPGPVTYTYDNAGNMITSKSGSSTTTYTYDYRDRLTGVETNGTIVATYTYNALDQRIGVDDSGTQTWTVYNGTSPDANPYDDFSAGSLTMSYLSGASVVNGAIVSGILARTNSSGTTNWYLTDKLGSVREIVGTLDNVLDQIVYDSFGNIVTETNESYGDRFKFAGMQYDATTGQYYDHARWYEAPAGRFTGADPLGFAAGDSNTYRYAGNEVTYAVDTSGLIVHQILAGAGVGLAIGGLAYLATEPFPTFGGLLGAMGRGAATGAVAGLTCGLIGLAAPACLGTAGAGTVGGLMLTGAVTGAASSFAEQMVMIFIEQRSFATFDPYGVGVNALIGAASAGAASRFMTCFVAGTQVLMAGDQAPVAVMAAASNTLGLEESGEGPSKWLRELVATFCLVVGAGAYLAQRKRAEEQTRQAIPAQCEREDDVDGRLSRRCGASGGLPSTIRGPMCHAARSRSASGQPRAVLGDRHGRRCASLPARATNRNPGRPVSPCPCRGEPEAWAKAAAASACPGPSGS